MAEKSEKQKKEKKESKSEKAGSGTPDFSSGKEDTRPQNPQHLVCWISVNNHSSTKSNERHILFHHFFTLITHVVACQGLKNLVNSRVKVALYGAQLAWKVAAETGAM